jgi:hypothetical protein
MAIAGSNITTGFKNRAGQPATKIVAVVPSDTTDLATGPTRGLHVSVAGTVTVDFAEGGTNIALGSLPIGVYPYSVRRVRSTGTAATVLALY